MFHSEQLARTIHDDRVREIERTSRERLLLQAPDEAEAPTVKATESTGAFRVPAPAIGGGSAREPA